jgi:serine/threonine-protein kinase
VADGLACPHCAAALEPHHRFCAICGAALDASARDETDPLIGCTLPGGHVVTELIDVGGMGRVYRAEQKMLGRTVAVKIIHPHLLGEASIEARFITEARAASQLNQPNSVAVIDFGKHEGRFYLVMEYLRGRDLATIAHEQGPLPPERAVDIVCQALGALGEAHYHGIVHRDLKPENLVIEPLRTGGDFVKVLDFGLAKFRESLRDISVSRDTRARITLPGMICGTPEYMAPEQAKGTAIDARTDLYALGVLLFELLTGALPFEAGTPNELALMHISSSPPDPRSLQPAELACDPARRITSALAECVLRALAKEPDERFQSAEEMSVALRGAVVPIESRRDVTCEACGAQVPRSQKFCGECGAAIARRRTTPPPNPGLPGKSSRGHTPLPLSSRERELAWLDDLCGRAAMGLTAAIVEGPAGSGRTRLCTELLREHERRGSVVVTVGPDPWWASVGWYALRQAINELADLPDDGGTLAEWRGASPEARAGLGLLSAKRPRALSTPPGRRWSDTPPDARLESDQRILVAEALRWAVAAAAARARHQVILLVDDLQAIDGASRNAFADLAADPPPAAAVLIGVAPPGFDPEWEGCERLCLEGIPAAIGAALLSRSSGDDAPMSSRGAPSSALVAPLYIDQLMRHAAEEGADPPARLADLIAARLQRLPADARRTLQAVAVLGDAAASAQLVALLPDVSSLGAQLACLRERGLVVSKSGEQTIVHPLIREIVLAGIPQAVRAELHSRARRDFGDDALHIPLEANALHAFHAGESFEAMMLLERVGDRAAERGDYEGQIQALSRALEMARHEVSRGDMDDPIAAALMFSGKLGDALTFAGRPGDAIGVLREALGIAAPNAPERARLLASLAHASREQGLLTAARKHLDEALSLARSSSRSELASSLEAMQSAWQTPQ